MKQSSAGIVMVLVAALVAPIQGIAASDPVTVDSAVLVDSVANLLRARRRPLSQANFHLPCRQRLLLPQTFGTFPQSAVATLLEEERCYPILGQDLLEATIQNSIVPWVGHLPCRVISVFEISSGKTSPRMSSN